MIAKIVDSILDEQSERKIISDEEISVYRYGYTLMLEVLVNIMISVILGLVLGELPIVAFFLLMFMPLRSYCGGYHAPKAWICAILSNLVVAGAVLTAEYLEFKIGYGSVLMTELVCSAVIVFFAPMQSEAKPLSDGEVQKYKKYSRWILSAELLLLLIVIVTLGTSRYGLVIMLAHAAQAGSLISGYIKEKRSRRTASYF